MASNPNWKRNNRPVGGRGGSQKQPPREILPEPVPEDFVDRAEQVMKHQLRITTSKIRNIYSLATEIYNREQLRTEDTLLPDSVSKLQMMRVRVLYEGGRDPSTRQFIEAAHLLEYIKGIGTDRGMFLRFTQYLEALVAYHRYYGGREG